MSTLEISRVDIEDDAALASWHGVAWRADRHDRGENATTWTLPELTAQLRSGRRSRSTAAYVGTVDGTAVAFGVTVLPMLDNTAPAEVAVAVDPPARRRGHGSAMLAHLLAEVGAQHRTIVHAEVDWPWSAQPDGAGTPGVEFARRHGFALGTLEVMRVLRLPVADDVLDDLTPDLGDYTLRSWVGPVPEDLLQAWAEMDASLSTEAPTGDLQVEAQVADTAAVREGEQLLVAQGRTAYRAVALAPDGTAVGYTEVVTTVHEPGRAYQWGTLVHGEHRGHRLGLALKVAALRLLQSSEDPAGPVDHVLTWNAETNAHMVGVNERLGFVPVERCGVFERRS
ncbi:MAG: GNAT family N-acetyltransferase [Nocardioides sp.]